MGPPTPFEELVRVMARLRGPDGCPWDRVQTLQTLRTYLLEETYELLEAIDQGDARMLKEELGDLLLEVVFLTQICCEQGLFDIDDVARGIRDKLVRRHPHVFEDRPAGSPREAIQRWEEIKNQEKRSVAGENHSVLDGVPAHLPALMRAHRLATKAGLAGFDWKGIDDLYPKLLEELAEFRQAADRRDRAAMEEELGDLLFMAANLARHADVDPEMALQAANRKFTSRFRRVEEEAARRGLVMGQASLEELDAIWNEVKSREPGRS